LCEHSTIRTHNWSYAHAPNRHTYPSLFLSRCNPLDGICLSHPWIYVQASSLLDDRHINTAKTMKIHVAKYTLFRKFIAVCVTCDQIRKVRHANEIPHRHHIIDIPPSSMLMVCIASLIVLELFFFVCICPQYVLLNYIEIVKVHLFFLLIVSLFFPTIFQHIPFMLVSFVHTCPLILNRS
jgi:hypothetical protein